MRFDRKPPKCTQCRNRIVNKEDHDEDCPDGHRDKHALIEAQKMAEADRKYDMLKEEGELD